MNKNQYRIRTPCLVSQNTPAGGMEWEQRMAVLDTAFNYSEFAPGDLADIRAALGRCARLRVYFRALFADADLRRPPSGDAAHVAGHPDLRRFRTGYVLGALLDEGVPVPPAVLAKVLACQPSAPRAWRRDSKHHVVE